MRTKLWIILVAIIAAAAGGVYFFKYRGEPSGPAAGQNRVPPASIKLFRLTKPNFVAQGENLSRVEIWAVQGGQSQLLGMATLSSSTGAPGLSQTWTLPVPAGLRGAAEVFARGYDEAAVNAAKIDLSPADLQNL